jgi:hypothetical protein
MPDPSAGSLESWSIQRDGPSKERWWNSESICAGQQQAATADSPFLAFQQVVKRFERAASDTRQQPLKYTSKRTV